MSKVSLNLDTQGFQALLSFQAKLQGREIIKCLHVPVSQQLQHTLCNATPFPIWQRGVLWQCLILLPPGKDRILVDAFSQMCQGLGLLNLNFEINSSFASSQFFTKIKYYSFKKHFHHKQFNMHRFNFGKLVCVCIYNQNSALGWRMPISNESCKD